MEVNQALLSRRLRGDPSAEGGGLTVAQAAHRELEQQLKS